jgi:hypothetical protein
MGISRSSIGKLAVSGYPGHIFVCKLRYGYGHQEHLEKLEILHSWFSDLNAFLPVVFKGKESDYVDKKDYKFVNKEGVQVAASLNDLMGEVGGQIDAAYEQYKPQFEGQSCDPSEKSFIKVLRGIKERLDVITAESKIIEGIKTEDSLEAM